MRKLSSIAVINSDLEVYPLNSLLREQEPVTRLPNPRRGVEDPGSLFQPPIARCTPVSSLTPPIGSSQAYLQSGENPKVTS
jgi:hypothetical protein